LKACESRRDLKENFTNCRSNAKQKKQIIFTVYKNRGEGKEMNKQANDSVDNKVIRYDANSTNSETAVPQIENVGGIARLIELAQTAMQFEKRSTQNKKKPTKKNPFGSGVYISYVIETDQLDCLNGLLNNSDQYLRCIDGIYYLRNSAAKLKINLEEVFKHTAQVPKESLEKTAEDMQQKCVSGIFDVLDSTKNWIQELITDSVETINTSLQEIDPIKPNKELVREVNKLNLSIKECYQTKNNIRMYAVAKNIYDSVECIKNSLTRMFGQSAGGGIPVIKTLKDASEGQKAVEYKISYMYGMRIKIEKQIPFPEKKIEEDTEKRNGIISLEVTQPEEELTKFKRLWYAPWKKILVLND
jgi:hypothetical protein